MNPINLCSTSFFSTISLLPPSTIREICFPPIPAQWRHNILQDLEKEKEHGVLLKDLVSVKVQLEAKDLAYKQALHKLDHFQKAVNEFSVLLMNSESEKDAYINGCKETRMHMDELEAKMKVMADQLSEAVIIEELYSHVVDKLEATQVELFSKETELDVAREAKLEALTQAEILETALNMEKEKTEGLLRHVTELNETIFHSKLAAIETQNEKHACLSEKEAELQSAMDVVSETQEKLERMKKKLEMMQSLENHLPTKSASVDLLQLELQQANELQSSAEKAASNAINELDKLKLDLELQEKKKSDQAIYIVSLESALNKLKRELANAKEEVSRVKSSVQIMTQELERMKSERNETRGIETEAQVEIALLKSELHKGRSKIAAAEAAEQRAKSEKSALHLALQQLALEVEEAKKVNQRLKEEANKENNEITAPGCEQGNSFQDNEVPEIDEPKTGSEEREEEEAISNVTISKKQYDVLIEKAKKVDQDLVKIPENRYELETLKKELEIAMVRIGEFRTRAEQAVSRAEAAEKAKAALEEQLRRSRQQKERRRAAAAALREESICREISCFESDCAPEIYQPLGEVLNIKF